jgi:site-specific DNA-methyltransferase (adenine-specific)
MQIIHGDCREALKDLADDSIDAIITDPPYNLTSDRRVRRSSRGFMNQEWDTDVAFDPEVWRECLRVLKPGGHLAAFGASRTHHRLWTAIEDAGFEIRETVMWVHAQGFPKALDIAKSIQSKLRTGQPRYDNTDEVAFDGDRGAAPQPSDIFRVVRGGWTGQDAAVSEPEAARWQGWHTALKPAHEPICLARKPLSGTVATNVMQYGTGGLNIDACRVPIEGETLRGGMNTAGKPTLDHAHNIGWHRSWMDDPEQCELKRQQMLVKVAHAEEHGRWPPNVLHDGSDEVLEAFAQFGKRSAPERDTDSGSASRFYFCAKAGKRDRAGSSHPTVKPLKLMEWLVRLLTPPGGVVLDPFAGSGTTGEAALLCGFDVVLIEQEAEYVSDIERRLAMFRSA